VRRLSRTTIGLLAASALAITLAAAPMLSQGADHLDAPGLSSPANRPDADINDVFVFNGTDFGRTVLAMTTHPGVGAIATPVYATDVRYKLNVDRTGDAIEDLAYVFDFAPLRSNGTQTYTVTRYTGFAAQNPRGGTVVARGTTGVPATSGSTRTFAGLRSDPFFFDLDAFRQAVLGQDRGRKGFCDQAGGAGIDFFGLLNTNAVVVEVPDGALGGKIGVWGTTIRRSDFHTIDRMGRPAINTVFNSGEDKNAFNAGQPRDDRARFGANVKSVLAKFSALDKEGPYTGAQLDTLAGVLLPDVITYDTATQANGPLNGRWLADDVIDAELNIVTGGFAFPGRDGSGAIGGDCVGQHADLTQTFPYLGAYHR
jgi:hypothetical protein